MKRLLNLQKMLIKFSATSYFKQKEAIRMMKQQNSFIPQLDKLVPKAVNLKDLVPNFFSTHLPIYQYPKTIVENMCKNYMENSFIMWEIPISTRVDLKNSLIKFRDDELRIGRVMEVMDSVAGYVSYRHCFGSVTDPNKFSIVTGSVDSFHLFDLINAHEDIKVEGFLNYVGKTSMEVEINLFQGGKLKSNSLFMMISRDSSNMQKGYQVPGLLFDKLSPKQRAKAQKRHQQAIVNTRLRKKQMQQSYEICPPSKEEIEIIHKQFLQHRRHSQRTDIPIKKTIVTNTLLMHLQERNIHGKIFGGFLMRQMLDVGWIVAKQFLRGAHFSVQDFTNVYFKSAVEIGTGLRLHGGVTYVQNDVLVITVQAYTIKFSNQTQKMSCYLHMIIRTETNQQKVYPESYQEALAHLSSKKACNRIFAK